MHAIHQFEKTIADFYGSPYAVAVDCCTHAIELCLRICKPISVSSPMHTYPSIPMTFNKLGIKWQFEMLPWREFYYIGNTNIIDAAVYWKRDSYIPGTMMCLSFQFKKHLNIGRGGMILLDDPTTCNTLRLLRYDGRYCDDLPWAEQDITTMGYHYYMTPENALIGLERFHAVKDLPPRIWSYLDYPDISKMTVFKNVQCK